MASRKLHQASIRTQFLLMAITLLQLLSAGASILSQAAGGNSPALAATARLLLLIAPLRADVEINPYTYYLLFMFMVLWTLVSAGVVSYVTVSGTSLPR
jgi:hypothetical protein